jgi:hypothetical protein
VVVVKKAICFYRQLRRQWQRQLNLWLNPKQSNHRSLPLLNRPQRHVLSHNGQINKTLHNQIQHHRI